MAFLRYAGLLLLGRLIRLKANFIDEMQFFVHFVDFSNKLVDFFPRKNS